MKASKIQTLAIAGGLLLATASSSMAITTLTGTGGSIDFDQTTVTFTNWVFNSVNALAPTGLSYTGFVLNPVPVTSIITPDQSIVQYNIGASMSPVGLLSINFLGDTLSMDFSAESLNDVSQTANFLVGYEQVVTVINDTLGGDFVVPTMVGTTLTWDLNNRLPVQFSSNITLTGSVIPEPITAALGMAGVMMLGLRLTGRRSR